MVIDFLAWAIAGVIQGLMGSAGSRRSYPPRAGMMRLGHWDQFSLTREERIYLVVLRQYIVSSVVCAEMLRSKSCVLEVSRGCSGVDLCVLDDCPFMRRLMSK